MREGGNDGVWYASVLEDSGGSLVVYGYGHVHEGPSGHEVTPRGLVGSNQHVCGLTRGYEDGLGGEGLDVDSIDFYYSHSVASYGKEELIVECGIDDP